MKKSLGILALFIVIIISGYFVTGLITERTLKKNLQTLNQANGTDVELASYSRGLLTSKATLAWHMEVPEKKSQDADGRTIIIPPREYTFDIPMVIHHGPVMIQNARMRFGLGSATGELNLPSAYQDEFNELFTEQSTKPKLYVRFFVSFLNKAQIEMDIPEFELFTKKYDTQIKWLGMESALKFSPESTRLQGHFELDGLRVVGQKYRIILNKVATQYDVHKSESGLFLGLAGLNLPILQVTADGETQLQLKQLELESNSDVAQKLFYSYFKGSFVELISESKHYGPAELEISVKNIDADTLAELNKRYNKIKQADTSGGQTQQLVLSLLPDVPKLLEKGAVFELTKLKLSTQEMGQLDAGFRLAFPVIKEKDGQSIQLIPKIKGAGHIHISQSMLKFILTNAYKELNTKDLTRLDSDTSDNAQNGPDTAQQNPEEVNQKISIDSDATIEQKASQMANDRIAQLVHSGALQTKGSDYVLELKLSSGRVLVNGHPFTWEMLSL